MTAEQIEKTRDVSPEEAEHFPRLRAADYADALDTPVRITITTATSSLPSSLPRRSNKVPPP